MASRVCGESGGPEAFLLIGALRALPGELLYIASGWRLRGHASVNPPVDTLATAAPVAAFIRLPVLMTRYAFCCPDYRNVSFQNATSNAGMSAYMRRAARPAIKLSETALLKHRRCAAGGIARAAPTTVPAANVSRAEALAALLSAAACWLLTTSWRPKR